MDDFVGNARKLYRFGDHQMMQFYDVPTPWYAVTIHHDLRTGAYLVAVQRVADATAMRGLYP